MALKLKNGTSVASSDQPSISNILETHVKKKGGTSAFISSQVQGDNEKYGDLSRLPFGIFPLDYILAGGMPLNRITEIWGKESSGKTVLALKAANQALHRWQDKNVALIDFEDAYDKDWYEKFIDFPERFVVFTPDTSEAAADLMESCVSAGDVSMVLFDSLGSLISDNELESSSEKMAVGGQSMVIGKLVRKILARLKVQEAHGNIMNVIFINQLRFKIGQMFGNPETRPGGQQLRHLVSLSIKVYGKDVADKSGFPYAKEISCTIEKRKIPIFARSTKFELFTVDSPDHRVGHVESMNQFIGWCKEFGVLENTGKGFKFFGQMYGKLNDVKTQLLECESEFIKYQAKLISAVKEDNL